MIDDRILEHHTAYIQRLRARELVVTDGSGVRASASLF